MELPDITVIVNHEGREYSQQAKPSDVNFTNVMGILGRILHPAKPIAFRYEDCEGDLITVRTEEEAQYMLVNYMQSLLAALQQTGESSPLILYPIVSKASDTRNIENLTVRTGSPADGHFVQQSPAAVPAAKVVPTLSGNSSEGEFYPAVSDDLLSSSIWSGEPTAGQSDAHDQDMPGTVSGADIPSIVGLMGRIRHGEMEPLEVLGSGNGGTVYRALHKPTNEVMAMKEIPLDVSDEQQLCIARELDTIKKCDSELVIRFYDAYFLHNCVVFCTEYMDGGSLDRYGQIPEHILGRIVVLVVKGLYYLQSIHIMHRDVKPSNMLVNSKGYVKLCDFGVSVQLSRTMDKAATTVGTCLYMAPERVMAEEYDLCSDVWSLGIAVFEMATGEHPLQNLSTLAASRPFEFANELRKQTPPRLPEDQYPAELVDFVAQCLVSDSSSRPKLSSLLHHLLIQQFDDGDLHVIAQWVHEHAEARHRQRTQQS